MLERKFATLAALLLVPGLTGLDDNLATHFIDDNLCVATRESVARP